MEHKIASQKMSVFETDWELDINPLFWSQVPGQDSKEGGHCHKPKRLVTAR